VFLLTYLLTRGDEYIQIEMQVHKLLTGKRTQHSSEVKQLHLIPASHYQHTPTSTDYNTVMWYYYNYRSLQRCCKV